MYFIHRLVNKRQEILETNSVISRKSSGGENELAKYDVTKPIILFPLQGGHFWFVFVKLSEIVGFSYLGCYRSYKTYF